MNRRAQEMVEQSQKITILGERRVCFTDFHTPFGGGTSVLLTEFIPTHKTDGVWRVTQPSSAFRLRCNIAQAISFCLRQALSSAIPAARFSWSRALSSAASTGNFAGKFPINTWCV